MTGGPPQEGASTQLYAWQAEALQAWSDAGRTGIVEAVTGTGKTRVGQAATSEFALLPNPNPSGNFTKITQRLPVRIAVRQAGGALKPGMMVELEAGTGD